MERTLACGIKLKLVNSEYDLYLDMALDMLEMISRCQKENRPCALIVPVGPTGQYPILAELVNRLRISLHHVHFFNMDEYLWAPERPVEKSHSMSLRRRMESDFYNRVDSELLMPQAQRHFPQPGQEHDYDRTLDSLGQAEGCFGGLGINGHIAFNEPPEDGESITAEDFSTLGTRVLRISRETRTINAYGYQRGDILGMPEYCVTIGMKQILASKSVYIALSRDWQYGIAKHVLNGPVVPQVPASLLQRHPSVRFCAPQSIGEGL